MGILRFVTMPPMPDFLVWFAWFAVAYVAGTIPFGLLLGRLRGVDIREHGSRNIGATNCGRVLGKKWGIACFVLDVFKGLLPVLGYGLLAHGTGEPGTGEPALATLLWLAVAAAAVLGHVFPVWLGFRGGKGVATGLGVLLGFWPVLTLPAVAAGAIWFIVVKATGYVSLASVVAAMTLPVMSVASAAAFGRTFGETLVFFVVTAHLAGLVVLRHRGNIANLRAGTESRAAWARRTPPQG